MKSAIYKGNIVHHRLGRVEHRFAHKLPWFLLDLEEIETLQQGRLFTVNRPGILSFYDSDHGARDGTPLSLWVTSLMAKYSSDTLHYKVLCLPRFFGYVFNPISIIFCYNQDNELTGIVYEVHNTFGESCTYIQMKDDQELEAKKTLHVSPFFSMNGHYKFSVTEPRKHLDVKIHYFDQEGSSLFAGFRGVKTSFNINNLLKILIVAPFTTIGVTLDIHWQALRLWFKGLRLYHKQKTQDI
ncbi:MAG: DUF1365 domain-containing protein [Candidatus Azotimanducaceae bacterium]|nr:DUF1365 domain-containing protein [Gammaproteobacteria bacterium]OUV68027.1 MAG: hypothetical protein CBC93_03380 [Gammaproteobacteria bacterium TMED133]